MAIRSEEHVFLSGPRSLFDALFEGLEERATELHGDSKCLTWALPGPFFLLSSFWRLEFDSQGLGDFVPRFDSAGWWHGSPCSKILNRARVRVWVHDHGRKSWRPEFLCVYPLPESKFQSWYLIHLNIYWYYLMINLCLMLNSLGLFSDI